MHTVPWLRKNLQCQSHSEQLITKLINGMNLIKDLRALHLKNMKHKRREEKTAKRGKICHVGGLVDLLSLTIQTYEGDLQIQWDPLSSTVLLSDLEK